MSTEERRPIENNKPTRVVNSDGSVTINLGYPFTLTIAGEAKTFSALTLRRPKTKDLKSTDGLKGDTNVTMALLKRLSGVDAAVIDELDSIDLGEASSVVTEMMGKAGPATGEP